MSKKSKKAKLNGMVAHEQPKAICSHCGKGEVVELMKLPDQDYGGIQDGVEYSVILRTRVQCQDCSQVQILRGYR